MHVPLVEQFWHELVFTVLIAIVMGAAMWPIKKISKAYKELLDGQKAVQTELSTQRTNCLTTLQAQGDRQVDLLVELNKTLTDMHLDQRTLLGLLGK